MASKYKPDDDFDSEINSNEFDDRINTVEVNNINEQIEIQNDHSQLASTPGKNLILLSLAGLVSIYFIYSIVFKTDENEEARKKLQEITNSQPVDDAVTVSVTGDSGIKIEEGIVVPEVINIETEQATVSKALPDEAPISWPDFDFREERLNDDRSDKTGEDIEKTESKEPPMFVAPPLEEEVIPIPPVNETVSPVAPSALELAQIEETKRKQPMLLKSGSGSPSRSAAGNDALAQTSAETVKATFIGDTDTMIAQGKMIDVVLETAINTNLEGLLRAVVSRNVYAESGNNILIPKGSRLIGSYGSPEANGNRIAVSWDRVIMPDGIDVQIGSPGTDVMGRSGVGAFVDKKFFDIFSNAILLSIVTIGGSAFVDEVTDAQGQTTSTTTTPEGNSTSSRSGGTSTDAAVLDAASNMSDVASSITEGLLDETPTMIVQQGTKMKVFVNKDIHFPSSVASRVKFIN